MQVCLLHQTGCGSICHVCKYNLMATGSGNVVATKNFFTDIFYDKVKYAYMSSGLLKSFAILCYICALTSALMPCKGLMFSVNPATTYKLQT